VNSPQDSLTFLEQIACDTIERGEDIRLLDMYNSLKIKMKDSSDFLINKGMQKEEVQYLNLMFNEYGKQIDSLSRYFKQNGYPDNTSMEDLLLIQSYSLIRRFNLDSSSFYKNVGIAYWNAGVKHFNKGNRDSACLYFNKLDKWAWRDSVLAADDIAFIGKTCYPDVRQTANPKPEPKLFRDADFEVFQVRKIYGYRNSKTKAEVIPPQYQNALSFSEGLAAVRKGVKWGFIDYFGNEVIPAQYDAVLQSFKGDRAQVQATLLQPQQQQQQRQFRKEIFLIDKKGRKIPELVLPSTLTDNNGRVTTNTQATIPDSKKDPFEGQMVYVEGGTFEMGCDDKRDGDCQENEKPVHKVILSSYSIGKYEVTQKQWNEVMGRNPEEILVKGYEDKPVERVSYDDIQAFFKKLNEMTGKKYRLPTEAEWEYAARGGNKSRYYKYSGSNDLKSVAWFDENSGNKTHPVGTLKANELGIYDMSGNVLEMSDDFFDKDYYKNSPLQNPKRAGKNENRVVRGGSWDFSSNSCRVSSRIGIIDYDKLSNLGFRCVRSE
jgi:formylglycine-generating enzyme required for sulfatase activity